MRILRLLLVVVLFGLLLLQARAVNAAPPSEPQLIVKNLSLPPVPSLDGKGNYEAYCAACHGRDGKGYGPAAHALDRPVPDLTGLIRRSGKFDSGAVTTFVTGTHRRDAADGKPYMPTWGRVFTSVESPEETKLRIYRLAKYVEAMQPQ